MHRLALPVLGRGRESTQNHTVLQYNIFIHMKGVSGCITKLHYRQFRKIVYNVISLFSRRI